MGDHFLYMHICTLQTYTHIKISLFFKIAKNYCDKLDAGPL